MADMPTRGFITIAREPTAVAALADTIRLTQSNGVGLSVLVPHGSHVDHRYHTLCEHVIAFDPHPTMRPAALKSAVYDCSPYDQTILLDDDMVLPVDISDWWGLLESYDLLFCSSALNYMGYPIKHDPTRQKFAQNRLPNVYTALMYFQKSDMAKAVFEMAKEITYGWTEYRQLNLQGAIGYDPTDDAVFACAAKETGYQHQSVRADTSWFTHVDMQMKAQGVAAPDDVDQDWTVHLHSHAQANGSLVIQQFLQTAPVKYRMYHFLQSTIIDVLRLRGR